MKENRACEFLYPVNYFGDCCSIYDDIIKEIENEQ